MNVYVTDTHALVWHLTKNKRLSRKARRIFQRADAGFGQILVPTIVLIEACYMANRQRLARELLDHVLNLPEDPEATYCVVSLDAAVARMSAGIGPAAVPEMPDRIIVATAMHLNLPLLTVDPDIEESELVKTVW